MLIINKMNYGSLIEDIVSTDKQDIYDIFTEYFNNPVMTKLKNENNMSMYVVKNYCLTSTTCRYIIAIVSIDDNKNGSEIELKDLNWLSLQTRTLQNTINNVRMHGYTPEEKGPLTAKINRIKITKEASIYSCDEYPITVTLLHTNKNTSTVYQPKGNIVIALETWETIITFS